MGQTTKHISASDSGSYRNKEYGDKEYFLLIKLSHLLFLTNMESRSRELADILKLVKKELGIKRFKLPNKPNGNKKKEEVIDLDLDVADW